MSRDLLRPIEPRDVARVWDLIIELAVYEKLEHKVVGTAESLESHLFGEPRYLDGIVLEVEGVIEGYALFYPTYSTFLTRPGMWLEDIYVTPTQRGKGFGKLLLSEVARISITRGCARLEWACLDWNQPSRDFYESLGARSIEEWIRYLVDGESLKQLGKMQDSAS